VVGLHQVLAFLGDLADGRGQGLHGGAIRPLLPRCGSVYAATPVIAALADRLSTALEDVYATLLDRGSLLPP
jgi:hypothetical protein